MLVCQIFCGLITYHVVFLKIYNNMIRTHLVKALYENLLGPKLDSNEIIEQPYLKYELGILNSSYLPENNPASINHILINNALDQNTDEIQEGDTESSLNVESTQQLDYLRREVDTELSLMKGVSSLGLTFILEPNNNNETQNNHNIIPQFKVCLTWGRYTQNLEFGPIPRMFDRHPNYFVTDWIDPKFEFKPLKLSPEPEGNDRLISMDGASLHILTTKIKNSEKYVIRIFLVNETEYNVEQRQTEIVRIFQPQIRVIVNDDSNIGDLDSISSQDNDDALLYRNSRTKANGYLCAAVWKDVDPESSDSEIKRITWKDSQIVPQNIKNEFICPDVRTEYLPLYTILQPEDKKQGFNAKTLSEKWNAEDIKIQLQSIEKNYGEWIIHQKMELDDDKNSNNINQSLYDVGLNNIKNCNASKKKISDGIDFLIDNKKARAAFCFMNAVMNDKRINDTKNDENTNGEDLKWREFQLAFILQSLIGVTGESPEERDEADVLWFPTGGGKTEAYLGIVIFALAYRRLSFNSNSSDNDVNLSNDGGVGVISRYTLRLLTVQQFHRALGAIVIADMKRVINWLPPDAITGSEKITDSVLLKKFNDGNFWGNQRFSIGLWIGNTTTPSKFAYQTIEHGNVLLYCEGALLPKTDPIHTRSGNSNTGNPDQIQNCPICKNILCIPKDQKLNREFTKITWIVRLSKNKDIVDKLTQELFENNEIHLNAKPIFELISNPSTNEFYYRLTLEIRPRKKNQLLERFLIDKWWIDTVEPRLVTSDGDISLQSTSPSMPGYFFLDSNGDNYDFAMFCTNAQCALNKFEWFEKLENKYDASVPAAFRIKNSKNISRSIPISAYVYDAQVYSRCPSFLITTVDKFAQLPFEPKCASIFGNVNVIHPIFGYGRRNTIESPISSGRTHIIPDNELEDISGFNPPSLILQDELHLIEGPLGSMMGIYEMAIDVLCNNGLKPKYIASSATIKEAKSQVGTIFRKKVSIFPKPGINSFDNYFSKIKEDQSCVDELSGRLYLGMLSYKTAVYLPLKSQSIIMAEIFKMRKYPELYDLTIEERNNINRETEPYWTFVSYFTDLALLSKFTNWYKENVMDVVPSLSAVKISNSSQRANRQTFDPGLRLFPIISSIDMIIDSVSIFCTNNTGRIRIALYQDGNPIGKIITTLESKECVIGENIFQIERNLNYEIKNNEKIWVSVINEHIDTEFESVNSTLDSFVINPLQIPADFPDSFQNLISLTEDSIKISINSPSRPLSETKNIQLSSETDSQKLVKHLEELDEESYIDSLQTSPVFGTGIDVTRLGIIQIMTQPKTNSGYIQSSGRVGRNNFGLVLTWLRAGRARDLNHYENFVGYHRMIHKFVEPITASPFSDEAMELCLGPIIVAILRNARKVGGTPINNNWITSDGAKHMRNQDEDADVLAVRDALSEISQSNDIAHFRKMQREQFENYFNESVSRWHNMASYLYDEGTEFPYAESVYRSTPAKNVVLGTPEHTINGLSYVFENTPNSLRKPESTAIFYGGDDVSTEIRPSQFITRYGPGTLISSNYRTLVIPSIQNIVGNLHAQPKFNVPNQSGDRGLLKYEINDARMKKILLRTNNRIDYRNLKLFSLPTNASLEISQKDPLYHCDTFPKWVFCTSNLHKSVRILATLEHSLHGEFVKCPECQRLSENGNFESKTFVASTLVVACPEGHLGDVNWPYEVHFDGNQCNGNVFEVISGDNDNIVYRCRGHWNLNNFIHSNCNASVDNLELKNRSNTGRISCTTQIAETGRNDPHGCSPSNNVSRAKLTNKFQMSIRMPIISTSMEIKPQNSNLFRKLEPLAEAIEVFVSGQPEEENIPKKRFVDWLIQKKDRLRSIHPNMIHATQNAPDDIFRDAIFRIMKFAGQTPRALEELSEIESFDEELNTLETQTREHGTGVSISSGSTNIRFPIQFQTPLNLQFEAMPFGKINVTQVQSGYSREISSFVPRAAGVPQEDRDLDVRIGSVISQTERCLLNSNETNEQRWYLANQLQGEGIFLHLDPTKHANAMDVFNNSSAKNDEAFITWTRIHQDTLNENNPLLQQLRQHPHDNAQEIDAKESQILKTNPLFVWWHSFAHEFINQLAIDSGFTGVSLGERVYCLQKPDGRFAAGIFIYASSPGTDGTLGGLTSLVDQRILPVIVQRTLQKITSCSNDPICSSSKINTQKRNGAACHICLMNSETSCAYFNKFLDRNLVRGSL